MSKQVLKLGIPAGSLQEATIELFAQAGLQVSDLKRGYLPQIDDEEIQPICLRAQEMSRYVADGVLDAGITGHDWIMENESDVVEVAELAYSKATARPATWVLAVPQESSVTKPADLAGGIDVKVEFSWGATEVKARLVDAIVELTETGASLRANDLRVIDTVITSTTRFIVNKRAWQDQFKRRKIESISILLNAAINARSRVGLKMNVKRANLDSILKILPAEKSPTVSSLADSDYMAVEVIIEKKVERTLVPALKRAGASGIITYPLNKFIH